MTDRRRDVIDDKSPEFKAKVRREFINNVKNEKDAFKMIAGGALAIVIISAWMFACMFAADFLFCTLLHTEKWVGGVMAIVFLFGIPALALAGVWIHKQYDKAFTTVLSREMRTVR